MSMYVQRQRYHSADQTKKTIIVNIYRSYMYIRWFTTLMKARVSSWNIGDENQLFVGKRDYV